MTAIAYRPRLLQLPHILHHYNRHSTSTQFSASPTSATSPTFRQHIGRTRRHPTKFKMAQMKALVTQEDHKVAVQETDMPTPAEGEIRVKVNYVAQNPTDW